MNRSNRKLVGTTGIALVLVVALLGAGLAFWPSEDQEIRSVDREPPSAETFPTAQTSNAVRRPNGCSTLAPLEERAVGNRLALVMELGPVSFSFSPDSIDIDSRLRADRDGRFGGLVTKVPLVVAGGDPRTGFIRGERVGGGLPPKFDYSAGDEALGDAGVYLEREPFTTGRIQNAPGFVPGAWLFPEPGCYQVFVTDENIEYGPFGIEVSAQS